MTAEVEPNDIAIVGMTGRFPGAADVDELWRRVAAGEDCLVDLDLASLDARGVPASVATSPGYVRRSGVLDGVDRFDAEFFSIGARDAAIMDPQHRHFLECSWEVLEQACIDPQRADHVVGVFAGCGMNTYLLNNLLANRDLVERMGWFLLRHTGNDKDFLSTGVSYRLDLRGPSINVQTACSTSLVAVHLAVQSLLAFECDVAIAGGATVEVPHGVGYRYHEGEILSPDGHCRAFDAASAGTVLTSGAAALALMRLSDALAAGNEVLAVVKGSAVNNDGNRKVSYLAPSVDGHADVVKEALAVAGLGARDLQLVEAHGTGTAVGDPIEVAALTEAFRATTTDVGFCRLVSTKPNIGHLDTAAGAASLVKVVQALRHRTLPPLANHTAPSPLLDLGRTPFVLSAEASPWPGTAPRRAGVSSLGVGGTNAHVIVEEAPLRDAIDASASEQVLVLSGRDAAAVDAAAARLADALAARPDVDLGDVAHTLARGRRAFTHRRAVVAHDVEDAVAVLRGAAPGRVASGVAAPAAPRLAFLFPGGGAQYARMAAGLDARCQVFHDVVAEGAALVRSMSDVDLRSHLADPDGAGLERPEVSLPAVFLTSVALARQWMAWGAEPDALAGHSLGEYAAAHLAGVLSFEDAIRLVVVRARLMAAVGGDAAMLVVSAPESVAARLTGPRLSLAVVNADDECVLAGDRAAVGAARDQLAAEGVESALLPLAAAAHSVLLDPVLDEFRAAVAEVRLNAPTRRYLSNRTGTWITADQATDPAYWVEHLRHTVRFREVLETLLGEAPTVTVELGPGQALSSYARRCAHAPVAAVPALRHPRQQVDDTAHTLHAFGRQWLFGVAIDPAATIGSDRRFVLLPTYPFQRQRHWIDPPVTGVSALGAGGGPVEASPPLERVDDPAAMRWAPTWLPVEPAPQVVGGWDVVALDPSAGELAEEVASALAAAGCDVRRLDGIEPWSDEREGGGRESDERAVALVGVPAADLSADAGLASARARWLGQARHVIRSLGATGAPHRVALVSTGGRAVDGPAAHPAEALVLGLALVAGREYPQLDVVGLDLGPDRVPERAEAIAMALLGRHGESALGERAGRLLRPGLEQVPVAPVDGADAAPPFVDGGTYLITGGLGAVGHVLATHLVASVGARLVLVTTRRLPGVEERAGWRAAHGPEDPVSAHLDRLESLEALGGRVDVLVGDVADAADAARIVAEAVALVGPIDGIVHAAGALADGLIELTTDDDVERVIGAKAAGALGLVAAAADHDVALVVLVSSTSTQLAPAGQMAYVAANAVLDACAGRSGDVRVVTLGLGAVQGLGMADRAAKRARLGIVDGERVAHPVFEEVARRAHGVLEVTGHLAPGHHWLLDEHRTTAGDAVLPGTGHLELLLGAAGLAAGEAAACSLVDVQLLTPLVAAEDRTTLVQVRLEDDGSIELRSDGGPGVGWVVHSTASLRPLDPEAPPEPWTPTVGPAGDDDAMGAQRAHLRLGPRWSSPTTIVEHDHGFEARLALAAEQAVDAGRWRAHPALVDLAVGLAVRIYVAHHGGGRLVVPIGAAAVESWAALPTEIVVRATPGDRSDAVDLDVVDPGGRLCLRIRGLRLWAVADGAMHLGQPDAIVATDWQDDLRSGRGFARLAEAIGLRRDELGALLDLVVAGDVDHVLASSVDLPSLVVAAAAAGHSAAATAAAPAGGGAVEPPRGRAAADDVLGRVAALWGELLGLDGLGADADFFDCGGHSLIAIRLVAGLRRELGVRIQLSDIFDAPTLADQVALVRSRMPAPSDAGGSGADEGRVAAVATEHRSLVTISREGTGRPLYIVHGAGGNVMFLWSLARALSGRHAVHGFQAKGIAAGDMPDPTVEAMAQRYVDELRAAAPGPYALGGYSGGGLVALEMVRQLREAGEVVDHLLLFDTVPPGLTRPTRLRRYRNVVANARRFGLGAVAPYLRATLAHAYHRVVPEDRERIAGLEEQSRAVGHGADDVVNLFHYFSAAAAQYVPSPTDVAATVFQADLVWPMQPADYYWDGVLIGDVRQVHVRGDHHSMFFPELVPQLAEAVHEVVAGLDAS